MAFVFPARLRQIQAGNRAIQIQGLFGLQSVFEHLGKLVKTHGFLADGEIQRFASNTHTIANFLRRGIGQKLRIDLIIDDQHRHRLGGISGL